MSDTIADLAAQIRERTTSVHALSMFGDHAGSAHVADETIDDLRRRPSHQLVHVIEVLADCDSMVLAQIAVQLASPKAREDATRLVSAATVAIYGTEENPTP